MFKSSMIIKIDEHILTIPNSELLINGGSYEVSSNRVSYDIVERLIFEIIHGFTGEYLREDAWGYYVMFFYKYVPKTFTKNLKQRSIIAKRLEQLEKGRDSEEYREYLIGLFDNIEPPKPEVYDESMFIVGCDMLTAIRENAIDVVESHLTDGIPIIDEYLLHATIHGRLSIMRLLLDRGAPVGNCLTIAIGMGNIHTVALLAQYATMDMAMIIVIEDILAKHTGIDPYEAYKSSLFVSKHEKFILDL